MNGLPKDPQNDRPKYVQAVPIYLGSDKEVAQYFTDYRDEISNITGSRIAILIAKEIAENDSSGVSKVVETGGRFPGLRFSDLPCLWIEDDVGGHAILKMPYSPPEIRERLRILADIAKDTKNAELLAATVEEKQTEDVKDRSPSVDAIIGGLAMKKSTERLTAVIFGVIFVAAILTIAIFIPMPTAFQYTVFRIVLALAAGGFVSMTPGFIEAQVGTVVRAGGALAVFVIVYFYAPAALEALKH